MKLTGNCLAKGKNALIGPAVLVEGVFHDSV